MSNAHTEPTPSSPPPRGFLAATFGAYFGRFGSMLVLGGLFSLPWALLVWQSGGHPEVAWWVRVGLHLLHLVGLGTITGLVLHHLAGDRGSAARMAMRAVQRMPAMMVASLVPLLLLFGLLWLGVAAARHAGPLAPVVMITTFVILAGMASSFRLSVTAAFVERRGGTACLARSLALTRGRRLRIFFAQLGLGILLSPLTSMLGRLEPGSTRHLLASVLVHGIFMGLTASFAAVVYAQLRGRRDGDAPAAIAADLAD